MTLVDRVRLAIEAVPVYYRARRRFDKSCWEVIHDLDPTGPLADETMRIVLEGRETECLFEASRLQALAVARAAAEAATANLVVALRSAVAVADEARAAWDAAPSGMRAGKLLIALSGRLRGYRPDIDAIHAALEEASL